MKRETISHVIGNIDLSYITEAEPYTACEKKTVNFKTVLFKTPLAACLVICLLTGVAAYASYEAYEWSTSVLFEDGTKVNVTQSATFKDIPSTAPKSVRTENSTGTVCMTHAEIEEVLGFDILDYENASSDTMGYTTYQNEDGSIGRVDLWWADFLYESEEKHMTILMSMLNQGADLGYVLAFEEGLDAAGGKELESIVMDEHLGTKLVVYRSASHDDKISIAFVYDNILYQFGGYGFTESEMLSIIRQMK